MFIEIMGSQWVRQVKKNRPESGLQDGFQLINRGCGYVP